METIEKFVDVLWKKVDPEDLKLGDQIYVHRRLGSYSHHGIYVGDRRVIHFINTEGKKISSLSRGKQETAPACLECGYHENARGGVIKTCIDCFRRDGKKLPSIHYFMYGAPRLGCLLKLRGTCSTDPRTRSPEEVVKIAYELLESKGFGTYNLTSNNCKHFATYCQTGERTCTQTSLFHPGWK